MNQDTMFENDPFEQLCSEELALYKAKRRDFAYGGEPLGNFRRVGAILRLYPGLNPSEPVVVSLVQMLKQFDAALWMIANDYEGDIETVDMRLQDVGVYAKIARLLHKERRK